MDSYHRNGNFTDHEAGEDVIDGQFDVYEERDAWKLRAHQSKHSKSLIISIRGIKT